MKFTHLASLALVPLAWCAVVPLQNHAAKPNPQNAMSVLQAAELEGNITALVHQLAMTVDNALDADAADHKTSAPVSINAIIDLVFLNDHSPDHAAAIEKATNIINTSGSNASQIFGNTIDGVKDFIGNDFKGGAQIGDDNTSTGDVVKESPLHTLPHVLVTALDRADEQQVENFSKQFKAAFGYLFTNYGTGTSPIEQLINDVTGTFRAFFINAKAHSDTDPQTILHENLQGLIAHLHDGIHPAIQAYVQASDTPNDKVNATVDLLSHEFAAGISNLADSLERGVGDALHQTESKGEIHLLIRNRVVQKIAQMAVELINSISNNARATNYMLHLVKNAEDAYIGAKGQVQGVQEGRITNGSLYTLLTDKNEMQKMISGLERTSEPLAITLGNLVYTFLITIRVPDYLIKPTNSIGMLHLVSASDLWFKIGERAIEHIQKESPFVGLMLKKGLALIHTVYEDNQDILANERSIANSISAMRAILDGFVAFLKEQKLQ